MYLDSKYGMVGEVGVAWLGGVSGCGIIGSLIRRQLKCAIKSKN